jgi:hypothetical protein
LGIRAVITFRAQNFKDLSLVPIQNFVFQKHEPGQFFNFKDPEKGSSSIRFDFSYPDHYFSRNQIVPNITPSCHVGGYLLKNLDM